MKKYSVFLPASTALGLLFSYALVAEAYLNCKPTSQINSFEVSGNIRSSPNEGAPIILSPNALLSSSLTGEIQSDSQNCWYRIKLNDQLGWVSHRAVSKVRFVGGDRQPNTALLISQASQTSRTETQPNTNISQEAEKTNPAEKNSSFMNTIIQPSFEWNMLQLLTLIIVTGTLVFLIKKQQDDLASLQINIESRINNLKTTIEQKKSESFTQEKGNNLLPSEDRLKTISESLMDIQAKIAGEYRQPNRNSQDKLANLTDELYGTNTAAPLTLLQQVITNFGTSDSLFNDPQKFITMSFPSGFSPTSLACDSLGRPKSKLVVSPSFQSLFLKFKEYKSTYIIPNILSKGISGEISQFKVGFQTFFEIIGEPSQISKIELEKPAVVEIEENGDCSVLEKGRIIFT